jgi:hypothetical protein
MMEARMYREWMELEERMEEAERYLLEGDRRIQERARRVREVIARMERDLLEERDFPPPWRSPVSRLYGRSRSNSGSRSSNK